MRYFFHVRNGQDSDDHDGTDLAGMSVARLEALHRLGAMMAEHPERFTNAHDWRMEVTNATGLLLFRIDLLTTESPAIAADAMRPIWL